MRLPIDIHREILSYVTLSNQLEYARMNRFYCCELMMGVRQVIINIEDFTKDFSEKRDSILKAIENPYSQLNLTFRKRYESKEVFDSEHSWKISLRSLCIDIRDFMRFRPRIDHLQHLTLYFHKKAEHRLIPIAELLDEVGKLPGLKELDFTYLPNFPQPPLMIPELRRLDILQCSRFNATDILHFKNLQFLKLWDCVEISDVRCLAHIYELHLINCSSVTDISGLNHNTIIHIDSCPIRDCNESFQFSKMIRLYHYNGEPVNLGRLERVQSLTIDCYNSPNLSLRQPPLFFCKGFPSSLRSLKLRNMLVPFTLPADHRLRELIVECCPNFSLQNLENIPIIEITSDNMIDWSALNHRSKVEISSSPNFRSAEALNNVKELVLIDYDVSHLVDLRYITQLKLYSTPNHFAKSFTNSLLSSATHLKEIDFRINGSSLHFTDKKVLKLLMNYPLIKRIVIEISSLKLKKEEFQYLVGDVFHVENMLFHQIVLSRKDKSEATTLFTMKSVLVSMIIIPIAAFLYSFKT